MIKAITLRSGSTWCPLESVLSVISIRMKLHLFMRLQSLLFPFFLFSFSYLLPSSFEKEKSDMFNFFIKMFNNFHVTIPFANAFVQIPNHFRFMQNILANKRKFRAYEIVHNKDFTIFYTIVIHFSIGLCVTKFD